MVLVVTLLVPLSACFVSLFVAVTCLLTVLNSAARHTTCCGGQSMPCDVLVHSVFTHVTFYHMWLIICIAIPSIHSINAIVCLVVYMAGISLLAAVAALPQRIITMCRVLQSICS
jgi:hypothetical protein